MSALASLFDFQTTLLLTIFVSAAFALGGILIAPTLAQHAAVHRKIGGNIAFCGGVGYRFLSGEGVTAMDYAVSWVGLLAAALIFGSSLRHVGGLPPRDRQDFAIGGFHAAMLLGLAAVTGSSQWTGLWASVAIAHVLSRSAVAAMAISGPLLARPRRILAGCFGLLALVSLAHTVPRIRDLSQGIVAIVPTPLTYVSLLALVLFLNIGLSVMLYLRLAERFGDLAHVDALTGALNRRGLGARLRELRARRGGTVRGALVMVDLDHFKSINDRHGHLAGDRVLQWFAGMLRGQAGPDDLLVRLGGEEFALVLPDCPVARATGIALKIRELCNGDAAIDVGGQPLRVTASFGVAMLGHRGANLTADLARADEALYAAKRAGRNRVQVWHPRFAPAAHPFGDPPVMPGEMPGADLGEGRTRDPAAVAGVTKGGAPLSV